MARKATDGATAQVGAAPLPNDARRERERAQLQSALRAVQRDGLQVLGQGRNEQGETVYAVPSRGSSGVWRLVRVTQDRQGQPRLWCDCPASSPPREWKCAPRVCAHRGAVHAYLVAQARAQAADGTTIDEEQIPA